MNPFDDFFSHLPEAIHADKIRKEWTSLAPVYDIERWQLPLPVWAKRPYEHNGLDAWKAARQAAADSRSDQPMCIYIHIPFCTSKCGFCDSYSFKLGNHTDSRVKDYAERICKELRLWSAQGGLTERPVTSVHLGGGTPTFLDTKSLERLAACIRNAFNITNETEWALESTVQSLTPSMTACLHDLGFRRLHVGVQSLEAVTRAAIGRRQSPAEALECIVRHKVMGWVVSVDLVCGLPEQTMTGWLAGIQALAECGTDGFSLYELLIYPQNREWAKRHHLLERSHLANYFLFQAGGNMLSALGCRKNLFNHWANDRDKNIYFTHPIRGEDLLAVGTIADGVFGNYHYRHPRYAAYLRSTGGGLPGLEGGLFENPLEQKNKPLVTAVLSNRIAPSLAAELNARKMDGSSLLERWLAHALIESSGGGYQLTNNGAWLAGNMIGEISSTP